MPYNVKKYTITNTSQASFLHFSNYQNFEKH